MQVYEGLFVLSAPFGVSHVYHSPARMCTGARTADSHVCCGLVGAGPSRDSLLLALLRGLVDADPSREGLILSLFGLEAGRCRGAGASCSVARVFEFVQSRPWAPTLSGV